MLYPIRLQDASSGFLVRLPCPDRVVFPEEKTLAKAATARNIGRALAAPCEDPSKPIVLNPNISKSKLKNKYVKIAQCMLQLAQPTFPRIGALVETSPRSPSVTGRPVTLNISNMVLLSNVPKSIFPLEGTTYRTADN
ncbi:putative phosphotransferase [Colletotrichum sublineola]|uniref:Putative phosphotransferase n=1 Tax=Colletotrichum sublineola TaxID=1173701 RepID=A0A066XT77_COLSU|nr:putative phosphotransferase [Colletotrichum sublineola]